MVNKKEKEFIRNFINLYVDKINLEFIVGRDKKDMKYKKDLEKVDKKIKSLLLDYSILFKDVNFLHKIFIEISEKRTREGDVFNANFKFFLERTFEELYNNKVIDKETFETLNKWLSQFDIEPYKLGPGAIGGLGV